MQVLKSFRDFFKHRNSLGLHFGHRWFMHFRCAKGFQDFAMHFLDEALSQDMSHIDNLPFLRNIQVVLGSLFSCITC